MPATPPAPGPAGPVPPPPPPPKLSVIKSPIAVYDGPFGAAQAERLLWRAGFGPRPGQAAELAKLGMENAVLSLTRPSGTAPMDGPAPNDDGDPLAPYDHYGTTSCTGSTAWSARATSSSSGSRSSSTTGSRPPTTRSARRG